MIKVKVNIKSFIKKTRDNLAGRDEDLNFLEYVTAKEKALLGI